MGFLETIKSLGKEFRDNYKFGGTVFAIEEVYKSFDRKRTSQLMEMECPASSMYPCLFSENGDIINKCPYGEMKIE